MRASKRLRFLTLIPVVTLAVCTPARDSRLRDVVLNYDYRGFLSPELFQTTCDNKTPWLEKINPEADARERLLELCRLTAVTQLAEYKLQYEHDKQRKQDLTPESAARSFVSIRFSWQFEQAVKLKQTYAEFLPGFLVRETEEAGYIRLVYRLSAPDMIEKVQTRDLPFTIRKSETLQ